MKIFSNFVALYRTAELSTIKPKSNSKIVYHIPVLLQESLEGLNINPEGVYVDVTFGGGGHSTAILERLSSKGRLIAFDQDPDAHLNAPKKTVSDKRFTLIHNNFRFLAPCLRAAGVDKVDGILADLGVSSHHFDTPQRGFSFRFEDEELDMRMNQDGGGVSAKNVVNEYELERLATILGRYGECDKPYKLAKLIEAARPMASCGELCQAVDKAIPQKERSKRLSQIFQALRIEVNGEMLALEMMLTQSLSVLAQGGRLSVISYHSLEDRLVKNFLRSGNLSGELQQDFYGRSLSPFKTISRKAIAPTPTEIELNSRARSAKLRVGELLHTNP